MPLVVRSPDDVFNINSPDNPTKNNTLHADAGDLDATDHFGLIIAIDADEPHLDLTLAGQKLQTHAGYIRQQCEWRRRSGRTGGGLPMRSVQQEFVIADTSEATHPECAHEAHERTSLQHLQTRLQLIEQSEESQEYLPSQHEATQGRQCRLESDSQLGYNCGDITALSRAQPSVLPHQSQNDIISRREPGRSPRSLSLYIRWLPSQVVLRLSISSLNLSQNLVKIYIFT